MNRLAFSLAISDLGFDRSMALTLMLAMAAVLTPLLILLGLKTGVIETARQQLLQDPRNLEIVIYQNTRLDQSWFRQLEQRPETRFVIPRTRTINATLNLVNSRRNILQGVEMLPTGEGDPLLPPGLPVPSGRQQILVTQAVAKKLSLSAGDLLTAVISRRLDGETQRLEMPLSVVAILREAVSNREAVFVSLDLLTVTEDYRDGYRLPFLGVDAGLPRPAIRQEYANARLYARELDDVIRLAAMLRQQGLEIRTRAAEIQTIQRMDRLLGFIFVVIAVIGSLGGAIALGANIWSNVDRKRRDLALLRLMGLGNRGILMIPVWHALAIALGAFTLAMGGYQLAALVFNRQLAASLPEQAYACQLYWQHILIMLAVTLLVAVLASLLAGRRAARIEPAECLREIG